LRGLDEGRIASLFVKKLTSWCMEDLAFLYPSLCDFVVHPVALFGPFGRFSIPCVWGRFLACLFGGFTHEVVDTLFLVICPLKTQRIASDLGIFGWTRVGSVLHEIWDSGSSSVFEAEIFGEYTPLKVYIISPKFRLKSSSRLGDRLTSWLFPESSQFDRPQEVKPPPLGG